MSYRRTLVFLIIFAGLAAFYYFYEVKGGEARSRADERATLLFSFESEDANTLTLRKAADTIVIERQDAVWIITQPVSAQTEDGAIDRILDALVELRYERDIGVADDLADFGLAEPETEIEVAGKGGILGTILLGAFTPDGSKLYVKLAGKEPVFTVKKFVKDALDRDLFDLRDKSVIDFAIPDITGVEAFRDGRAFVFEKNADADWMMTSPADHKADAGKIRRLLDSVRSATVKKFVEEAATDFDAYGLAPASVVIKLKFAEKTTALSLGDSVDPDESGSVFARMSDRPRVFELSAGILQNLSNEVDEWRDRSLLDFERDEVSKLQITSTDGGVTVVRSFADSDEWMLTEPESAAADPARVKDLLTYLRSLSATRFLKGDEREAAEHASATPIAQIRLWKEGSEAPLILSVSESPDRSEAYMKTEPGGETYAVHDPIMEELLPDPDRLKDKSALKFETTDVERIDVTKGERSLTIRRDDTKWDLPRGLELEDYEVDRLLWALSELDYVSIAPREKDDAAYGLDSPTMIIELWSAEADAPLRVVVGGRVPGQDSYYMIGPDEAQVMEIQERRISEWLEKL